MLIGPITKQGAPRVVRALYLVSLNLSVTRSHISARGETQRYYKMVSQAFASSIAATGSPLPLRNSNLSPICSFTILKHVISEVRLPLLPCRNPPGSNPSFLIADKSGPISQETFRGYIQPRLAIFVLDAANFARLVIAEELRNDRLREQEEERRRYRPFFVFRMG